MAILGNSRLLVLPLVLAAYVAWPVRPPARTLAAAGIVVAAAALAVAPWVARNQASVGCIAITTDARALWKANNARTYDVLAKGQWIDDVPELPGAPPWPELAADLTLGGTPTTVDECAQMRFYRDEVLDFWREQPGEKARLAGQAVGMLWRPTFTVDSGEEARSGLAGTGRRLVEPVYMSIVYALALLGAFLVPRRFLVLVLLLDRHEHRDGDGVRRHRPLPRTVRLPPRRARRVRPRAPVGSGARGSPTRARRGTSTSP